MTKDYYILEDDLRLICFEAKTFPDGVQEAFRVLNETLPESRNRSLFGISYPGNNGEIVYKAAATESFEGEAEKLGLENFIVRGGTYISTYIADFMSDESMIGKAFRELLADHRIDPNGCCVEMYVNGKDVRCMVRLDPGKVPNETEAL